MSAAFEPVLTARLTCPQCHATTSCMMPAEACQWFFDCPACGALLEPLPGDCCVFCSYADVPCPPIQRGQTDCCA